MLRLDMLRNKPVLNEFGECWRRSYFGQLTSGCTLDSLPLICFVTTFCRSVRAEVRGRLIVMPRSKLIGLKSVACPGVAPDIDLIVWGIFRLGISVLHIDLRAPIAPRRDSETRPLRVTAVVHAAPPNDAV